jgi:hypothetical protein
MMLSSGSIIKDSIIRILLNMTGKSQHLKTKASFSLFGLSERHQGLKIKTFGLKKSVLRPSLTDFFTVLPLVKIAIDPCA